MLLHSTEDREAQGCFEDIWPARATWVDRSEEGTTHRASLPGEQANGRSRLLHPTQVRASPPTDAITRQPLDVARIAFPLLAYFALMWGAGFLLGRALGMTYARTTSLAFTAAGNNYELAIAVCTATFGVTSGQALAGVVGALIEVPVLVGLVCVALRLRRYFPDAAQPLETRS